MAKTRQVDRLLLDRLVDGATTLSPGSYSSVHITLAPSDYQSLTPHLTPLLSQLLTGLIPLGTLHLLNLSTTIQTLPTELTLTGFQVLSTLPDEGSITAQKPAHSLTASLSLKAAAVPLLNRKKTDPATKKALWSLSSPATPKIDAEALLTPADKARPVPTCEPVNPSASRRKKACKGCSCGLADLEDEERKASKVVFLDGSIDGEAKAISQDERERLIQAANAAPKATSSCGSCFLGDAFRSRDATEEKSAFRIHKSTFMADIFAPQDSIQPEASTSASTSTSTSLPDPARQLCSICNHRYSIYNCPRCSTRTCSLLCSTGHKAATGCTGERDKAAYVPMNKYGWGTMMNDYVYLEEVGRRVGDWGKEIVRGGYGIQGAGASRGWGRGGDVRGRGRGRGRGRTGGNTKRDLLKMQLEARDIDMDVLPVGMERHKLNQSYWESKSRTAFLTIEFKIHPPRDPLKPSSQPLGPPYVLLTHRNTINNSLLTLTRQVAERALSKKEGAAPAWIRRILQPDPDDPNSFTPPDFVMTAQLDPRAAVYPISQQRAAYYRLDPSETLAVLLRNTHFVEFPTIEVWEEFKGTVVDVQGAVTEVLEDEEPRPKRRKLTAKAGKRAIDGLLGGYGTEDEDEQKPQSSLALLGGYTGSDDEDENEDAGVDEDALGDTDDEVEIDPAVLLELMRQAQGSERWTGNLEGNNEVDWGASGDEDEPE
ncbi:hypothetical protein D9615_000142 [Tricholomella constricta]|uniref:HIT-type domain-containing protein n=1 Tax=Tricholomella constricta TaxID=117010 RepID=A0A8H5HQW3_9AGAR|nr:hypothetical protein D9615_000142 [Tricholomella constricta]